MIYKDLLNDNKRKAGRFFTWLFGILTLISIIFTIVYFKKGFWVLGILISLTLLILYFAIFVRYYSAVQMKRLKEYLEINTEDTVFNSLLRQYFNNNGVYRSFNGYECTCHVNKKGTAICMTHSADEYSYQFVNIKKDIIEIVVADQTIEEQDIEDNEWLKIPYEGIGENLSVEELFMFCDEQFYKKAELNTKRIKGKWIDAFASEYTVKQLNKMKVMGKNSYLWILFSNGYKDCLSGDEARNAFNNISNKNAVWYMVKDNFAHELTNEEISKDFNSCGEIVVVDREYKWTYLCTHKEPILDPYFYSIDNTK